MATESFKYEILDVNGKKQTGTLEAANLEAARALLKGKGGTIMSLGKVGAMEKDIEIHIGAAVKPREMSVFCRQIQSVLKAGVTVIDALEMMEQQTENRTFKKAIGGVADLVRRGETLSDAMAQYPKIFPDLMIYMVSSGEASGNLDVAFDRLAGQFEKDARLRGLIMKAMIYPAILIVVVIAVVIVMMVYIVPTFLESFDELDAQLPGITLGVMAVSDFLVHTWYILLGVIVAVVAAYRLFKSSDFGSQVVGRVMLKLPLFGNLTIKSASAQLTRTLSTLLAAGIQMVDAVHITAMIMSNEIVKRALLRSEEEVKHGVPVSQPLEESGVFPPMVHHMIRIGEETGNMEEMLDKISEYFDQEVEDATEALTSALEPLIIIVMAAVVVPIILAIMLPMFTLYDSIG